MAPDHAIEHLPFAERPARLRDGDGVAVMIATDKIKWQDVHKPDHCGRVESKVFACMHDENRRCCEQCALNKKNNKSSLMQMELQL